MKRIVIITLGLATLAILLFTVYEAHSYYSLAGEREGYAVRQHKDDTLRVILIGDSWVEMHGKYDGQLQRMLGEAIGRPVVVASAGCSGQTSKEIYFSMSDCGAMRQLIAGSADYCVVIAGINDSNRKLGASYYAYHIGRIMDFLLQCVIKPVVVELPDYNIDCCYHRQSRLRKLQTHTSMLITGCQIDCLNDFRVALEQKLLSDFQEKDVLILRYPAWNNGGTTDWHHIYSDDQLHLNATGYALLDSALATLIAAQP